MHSTRFQIPFRKAEGREAGLKKKEKKGCIIVKEFTYTIGDPLGIHARPAGMLTKAAKVYSDTTVTITKAGKSAAASQLMKLMSLGVKQGDTVTVTADGPSEEPAIAAMETFFKENL